MKLTVDLSALPLAVREEVVKNICHEDRAAYALAAAEQARLNKFYRQFGPPPREGMGPLQSVLHVGFKNRLAARFGHKTVYQDPEFTPWLLKQNWADDVRVPEKKNMLTVGWTPEVEAAPKIVIARK